MAESSEINGILINTLFGVLNKKISTPTEYHGQVAEVKRMQENDVTGLIDSLSDFLVTSASVNFQVETDNKEFNKTMKQWLTKEINADFNGQIPRGIGALAEEYFKERWKSSSFPVLKILKWKKVNKILLPTKMAFVDGEAIYAEDDGGDGNLKLGQYKYYLGMNKNNKLDKGCLFTKPFARWFDAYPTPFMIKRGIYTNFKIIESLKTKQSELLNQVIPYMFLMKKGTEALALAELKGDGGKVYSNTELETSIGQIKDAIKDTFNNLRSETLTRSAQFDEELKHLIPDMDSMFKPLLFTAAEKGILGGFGFLDIAESVAANRKESILNPTAFVQEIERGVADFKNHILRELIYQIIEENKKEHRIYMNLEIDIVNSPVKGFMTDKFRAMIRSMYDRGLVSRQTAVEMGIEVPFEAEVTRLEREKARGLLEKQTPPAVTKEQNEPVGTPAKPTDDKKDTPDDKKSIEKKNFTNAKVEDIEEAPFTALSELPNNVKSERVKIRREWMTKFNNAYYFQTGKGVSREDALAYAEKVANSILKENK